MASSAVLGLLKGLGQGTALVGEKALNDRYEQLRMEKRQQYDIENLEKRIAADNQRSELQYQRDIERDKVNHSQAITLEEMRNQNNLDAMEKQSGLLTQSKKELAEWEMNNQPKGEGFIIGKDGKLVPADGKMPDVVRTPGGEFIDYRPKPSKLDITGQQKNYQNYLKRKQELENMLAQNDIDETKFNSLLASAQQDYGVESNMPISPDQARDQMIEDYLAKNKGRTKEDAVRALSTKFPDLFDASSIPAQDSAKPEAKKPGILNNPEKPQPKAPELSPLEAQMIDKQYESVQGEIERRKKEAEAEARREAEEREQKEAEFSNEFNRKSQAVNALKASQEIAKISSQISAGNGSNLTPAQLSRANEMIQMLSQNGMTEAESQQAQIILNHIKSRI